MAKAERVNVQRTLAIVGFFYFIYSAGKACLFPFLTIYFRQLGLTATQTGIILGIKPFVALLAAPFWVRCAIRHNKRRVILMGALFTLIAANLGLTLIPPVEKEAPLQFCNIDHSNHTDINSESYLITPLIDKIGQYVFHADSTETTATPSLFSTTLATSLSSSSVSTHKLSHAQLPPKNEFSSSLLDHSMPNTATTRALVDTLHAVDSVPFIESGEGKESVKESDEIVGQKSGVNGAQKRPFSGYISDHGNVNAHIADSSGGNTNGHSYESDANAAPSKSADYTSLIAEDGYKKALTYLKEKLKSKLEKEHSGLAEELQQENQVTNFRVKRLPLDMKDFDKESFQNNVSVMTRTKEAEVLKEEYLQLKFITFLTAFVIVVLGELLSSPVDKICEDSLYETLDHIDELDKYGRHHVVSLIGMGLAAVTVTIAVHFSDCQIFLGASRIMIHFYAFALLCGITFLLAFCYPIQDPGRSVRHLEKLIKGLGLMLTDFHNIIVAMTLMIVGFLSASIQNYLFWLIQDLGGSELIMGLTVTVSAVAEIPLLFASGVITRKLGHIGTLALAVLAMAGRLLYFAYLWTPWAAVPIEILNIFCKGALWESAMLYAEHTAPPGLHRSMQIVMVVLYYGIGSSNGSVISGILFDHVGMRVLYWSFATVALLWAVVLIMVAKFIPKRRKLHYSKILRDEEDNNNDDDIFDDSDDAEDWLVNALKNDRF